MISKRFLAIIVRCSISLAPLLPLSLLFPLPPPHCALVDIFEVNAFLAKAENVGKVDVVEVFGGESGVGRLCVRCRLERGANFDLVIGFHLTREDHQAEVVRYIRTYKPLGIVLGTPLNCDRPLVSYQ